MAGDIYLFLDGIPGESTTRHYENWIDVMSYSIGVAMEIDQESRTGGGGGFTSGNADPEDITVETKMSIASPVLLQCCALGAVIPRGRLIQFNIISGARLPVADYSFGDSIISNVSESASGGGLADESVSINFGSIIWRYHCYNHYNPLKHLMSYFREWSVISARPDKADASAHNALNQIAYGLIEDIPRGDTEKKAIDNNEKEGKYSYSKSAPAPDTLGFSPGPVVYHSPEPDK